jgi:hypothetical protein
MVLHGNAWIDIVRLVAESRDRLRQRMAVILERHASAVQEYKDLVLSGKATLAQKARVQEKMQRLWNEYVRLEEELSIASAEESLRSVGYSVYQRPMREVILDVLDELSVPTAPRSIDEYARASRGVSTPATRFASLRRDEERAFRREPTSRPAWVVPALYISGFTPMPRFVAASTWELEKRLIGARTIRINQLKTVMALLLKVISLRGIDNSSASRVEALLRRSARTVSGAIGPTMSDELDPHRMQSAVEAELKPIEALDFEARHEAAIRLKKMPPDRQLWGLPAVVEGGAHHKRFSGR